LLLMGGAHHPGLVSLASLVTIITYSKKNLTWKTG